MKRGIVLSIENKKAVLMTADGQFISIPHEAHMRIGEETSIQAVTKVPKRAPKRAFWYSGAAAAILLFMIPFFFLTTAEAHPVVAYVSLDINPSIEIGVDKEQRVQELKGLNNDGKAIISGLSYKGKPVDVVAATIMSTVAKGHYLDKPDKDIVITSLILDNDNPANDLEQMVAKTLDDKVKETIRQMNANNEPNVTVLSVPTEVREEAAANGISSGKMAVYLMAKDEGYDIKLEQLKVQSIADATESIGGVKKIVEQGASKEKLKELAKKEKQNKKQASATPAVDKAQAAKPAATPVKSTVKAESPKTNETQPKRPTKPNASERPSWSKDDKSHKPNRPVKPITPAKPSGSDKDKKQNGDWSNSRREQNDDSDDDKRGNSNNNKDVSSSNKLEKWSWYNNNNNNDDNDRWDKNQDDSDSRRDRNR